MKKKLFSKFAILVQLVFCLSGCSSGASYRKLSVNKIPLKLNNEQSYSFFVAGNVYGSPWNNLSTHPSASLLANIDSLKGQDVDFFISLGNLIRKPQKIHLQQLEDSFFNHLNIPVFNAVGSNEIYGSFRAKILYYNHTTIQAHFSFKIGTELFLFLDTESHDGHLGEEQLNDILQTIKKSSNLKNIFVLSHRLIWANNEKLSGLTKCGVKPKNFASFRSDFQKIEEALSTLPNSTSIYYLSGAVGVKSLPVFHFQSKNRHYIAVGLGDRIGDSILKVDVNKSKVQLKLIPLTNTNQYDLKDFNLDFCKSIYEDFDHQLNYVFNRS